MNMKAGSRIRLTVEREVPPNGFFLTDGSRDVLLHYSEIEGSINIGDTVDVFIYHDTKDRLAATMKTALLQYGEAKQLEVSDVNSRLGCFMQIGLGRELLLPADELPLRPSFWPKPGDKLFVRMERDKQGRMIAVALNEAELRALTTPAPKEWMNERKRGHVYKSIEIGSFLLLNGEEEGQYAFGFIHESERTRQLRFGEEVEARVTFVRDDGSCNMSMTARKEVKRSEDAAALLNFLQERPGGAMPYSDDSPADIVQQRFEMSKAAFKRALGKLMKENIVYQEDGWTYLRKE